MVDLDDQFQYLHNILLGGLEGPVIFKKDGHVKMHPPFQILRRVELGNRLGQIWIGYQPFSLDSRHHLVQVGGICKFLQPFSNAEALVSRFRNQKFERSRELNFSDANSRFLQFLKGLLGLFVANGKVTHIVTYLKMIQNQR